MTYSYYEGVQFDLVNGSIPPCHPRKKSKIVTAVLWYVSAVLPGWFPHLHLPTRGSPGHSCGDGLHSNANNTSNANNPNNVTQQQQQIFTGWTQTALTF